MEKKKKDRRIIISNNRLKIFIIVALTVFLLVSISSYLFVHFYCVYTKNYNINHVTSIYNDEYNDDVHVPEEVVVYFSDDIKTCNLDIIDTKGIYYYKDKSIYVLDSLTDDEKKVVIMHELAHHYYHYNMSDSYKEQLKYEYKLMCENPNEMYAYREQLKYQLFIGMEMMNYE
jgi:hypothetical protein